MCSTLGTTIGHSDGRVPALHPEHLWGHPLPQNDLDGGHRGRPGLLHHRLHVLLYSEWGTTPCH